MSFAERLKALRKRKGYSQTELAELIDVHYTQISRYERSETMPNAQVVVNIAKALESTVDYLVSGPSLVSGTAETVVIQLNHPKAMQLLSALEELDLIHILKKNMRSSQKLSDKYAGKLSVEAGEQILQYINQSREEWERPM
ncbi:MAG: helix-turn-helix transcriptional regulator [Saprospiraceae bacterium]|nr:helix-turn-helix transcriptional regulator [Saprospiraceae bacterium]